MLHDQPHSRSLLRRKRTCNVRTTKAECNRQGGMAANKQKLSLQSTVLKDAMTLAFYNVEAGKLAALGLGALTMSAFMRTSRKASTPGPARPGPARLGSARLGSPAPSSSGPEIVWRPSRPSGELAALGGCTLNRRQTSALRCRRRVDDGEQDARRRLSRCMAHPL